MRTEKVDSQVSTARLWRILYTSSDVNGKTIAVSGLVAAPTAAAPSGGYPVVVVAHGTSGINRGCAPSIKPFGKVDDQDTAYDYLVGLYVGAGYAVVMADFEGLGVKGNNSYLVGEVEGRNVLDSARALKSFPEFTVNPKMLVEPPRRFWRLQLLRRRAWSDVTSGEQLPTGAAGACGSDGRRGAG